MGLAGCSYRAKIIEGPSIGASYPVQDEAPLPWISVLPTKRAIENTDVRFGGIASTVRYNLSFYPYRKKFQNVNLILLDYGILPGVTHQKGKPVIKTCDESFSKKYETLPERYEFIATFYEGNARPPAPPSFEQRLTMPTSMCYPYEAFLMMASEVVHDLEASKRPKLEVDLN